MQWHSELKRQKSIAMGKKRVARRYGPKTYLRHIYSDLFELGDLLRKLSEQARSRGEYAIQVPIQENEAVRSELSYFRRS
jgi:hypothetical protein